MFGERTGEENMEAINNNEHDHKRRPGLGLRLGEGLTYFLVGGGIGAVIALLFAPKSGSEIRGEIADVTRKGYDATLEKAIELKARSAAAIGSAKDKAAEVYDSAFANPNKGAEDLSDVVSATTGAVADGIDRMQNESAGPRKQAANGQKS